MSLVRDRWGNLHEPQPHEATFRGLHNHSKALVLIQLFAQYKKGKGGLTARQINTATGLSLESLRTLLTRWTRWKYVIRKVVAEPRPCFSYSIGERGARFVSARIPQVKYQEYVRELNKHKAKPAIPG